MTREEHKRPAEWPRQKTSLALRARIVLASQHEFTERQIRRGTHRITVELEQTIRSDLDVNNRGPKPFVCTNTADPILESIKRSCMRTSNSGH